MTTNPLENSHTLGMLRALAEAEAKRSIEAVTMMLKKKQAAAMAGDLDPRLDIMTAAVAQNNASIYHVGAAVCARLDILIEMFETARPDDDHGKN